MTHELLVTTAILGGALWRFVDGTSHYIGRFHIPGICFTLSLVLCILWSLSVSVGTLSFDNWPLTAALVWCTAFTFWNCQGAWFGIPWTRFWWKLWRWEEPIRTGSRFAVIGAIAVAPLVAYKVSASAALIYATACSLVGPVYNLLYDKNFTFGPFDGGESVARLYLGGAVIGGLALL